jgi:poly-gamma-glutamate system protein
LSWRIDNRRRWVLAGLAVLAVGLQVLLEVSRTPVRQRDYELKLAAAQLAAEAFDVLRRERLVDGSVLDLPNDPAGTGLVGPEYSPITNARGDIGAKRTTLNPNWAAAIVAYCREAGVKPGDPVAVAMSGSFPALNIAVLAALETLRAHPVVISSVGASGWGANDPDFTWLDMERILYDAGVIHTRSVLATSGGGDDLGRGLSPEGRRLIAQAAKRNRVELLVPANLEQSIDERMKLYARESRGRKYQAYVNVGGGVASLGSSYNSALVPGGLSKDLGRFNFPRKGTMILFAKRGIPVIQLQSVVNLARENGLPVAPEWLPKPGEGEIFVRRNYSLPIAAVVLLGYCALCGLILAPEIRRGIFDRLSRGPERQKQP